MNVVGGGVSGNSEITHINNDGANIGFAGIQYDSGGTATSYYFGYYNAATPETTVKSLTYPDSVAREFMGIYTTSTHMLLVTRDAVIILLNLPSLTL